MEDNSLNESMAEPVVLGNETPQSYADVAEVIDFAINLRRELQKVIIGMDETIEMLVVGLLTNGHILLEGVPGVAKTMLVKLLAHTLDVDYKRIQFTPDLMPSDVVGTTVYNMQSSNFFFRQGPVFSNIILADEINRAPAKTQAALFEVMEERQITVDGVTHPMNYPLYVIATQNPIEQEGTYRLPEAQLDRFLFRLKIGYPSVEEENQILSRFKSDFFNKLEHSVNKVFNAEKLLRCCSVVEQVFIKDELLNYIAQIVHHTRNNSSLFLGASPRASLAIMKTSKALAAVRGRDFVTPDDIQKVAFPVLNHRIILTPEREIEGIDATDVINEIIHKIEVPR
ncbi:MAG TPA: MoxR family ATPase [Bacteroidales bacterium]|nr:MoxR family ATPase [Bacteroidales bacterium]